MNVESRLIEIIGEPARRLHTARSRNDQVATDLRLYARRAALEIVAAIDLARLALCRQARAHAATLLPGYTHLQRAQVVTLGHHLLAYAEMLGRDRGRFVDAERRAGESPLGSGALAGTGLPIDRAHTASALGFAGGPTHNSLDAVSDRDFAAEIAFSAALLAVHLSRLGEELVLWSTTEFGFVRLGEGYCSGSSLMPQKRNPDIAELLRGKSGRAIGDLVALLTISKGLTLAYNKDLQETQEPLYDAVETAQQSLAVLPGLIAALEFDVERMRAAAGGSGAGRDRSGGGAGPSRDAVPERARSDRQPGADARRKSSVPLHQLDAADLRAIDSGADARGDAGARRRARRRGARRCRAARRRPWSSARWRGSNPSCARSVSSSSAPLAAPGRRACRLGGGDYSSHRKEERERWQISAEETKATNLFSPVRRGIPSASCATSCAGIRSVRSKRC